MRAHCIKNIRQSYARQGSAGFDFLRADGKAAVTIAAAALDQFVQQQVRTVPAAVCNSATAVRKAADDGILFIGLRIGDIKFGAGINF